MGKQPVLGMREREGEVVAVPVPSTDANMVQGQIHDHVADGSIIYSDEHGAYFGLEDLSYNHETVRHSAKEFFRLVDSVARNKPKKRDGKKKREETPRRSKQ